MGWVNPLQHQWWCHARPLLLILPLLAGCGVPERTTQPTRAVPIRPARTPLTRIPAPTPTPALPPLPTATARPLATIPAPTPLTVDQRMAVFESVWQTVADNYLYPDFRGVDWQGLHEEYAAQVEQASDSDLFYATLTEMVAQLGDEHSRFVPPASVPIDDASVSGRELSVGIGVVTRPKLEGAFIQIVFPGSPADRAGIRPRDRIIAVDGRPYQTSDGDLQGTVGSTVRVTIQRPGDRARDVVLERQEVVSRIAPSYRRFPNDIGYVAIPTLWASDMGEQVSGALTDLRAGGPLRGIVIDLRSNHGGWGEVLSEVLSHFVRGQVGTFVGRDAVRPLVVAPPAGPDLRRVPLVVLVDGDTASYAEVLAAVLQHEANATVVGVPSAGNTETIYAHAFADGSRLWLAQEGFRLRNGTSLEGAGVTPDVLLEIDWTRFNEDDDPLLLEALHLLGGGPK